MNSQNSKGPVVWIHPDTLAMLVEVGAKSGTGTVWNRQGLSNQRIPLFTHPEASAPGLSDARIRAVKDAVWAECEGFELLDEEARRILSAVDSLTHASAATVAEPDTDNVWPIVNITVSESGEVTAAKLYAPGLPAGNHDVYPVRVPYMDEHTEAWMAVSKALEKASPGYLDGSGNGIECAVKAIQRLAAQQQAEPSDKLDAPAQVGSAQRDLKVCLADAQRTVSTTKKALSDLVNAVRWWGTQEDGIPAEVASAFNAAHLALGWSLSHPTDFKAAAQQSKQNSSHEWDASGERCLKCGDKDWFAESTCSGKAAQQQAEPQTFVQKWTAAIKSLPMGEQKTEPGADERAARALCAAAAKRSDKTDGELWGEYQDEFIADAKAALLAAQSGQRAGVAEGWQLVPTKPTDKMIAAFSEAFKQGSIWTDRVTHAFEAAIAAAPTQQQEGGS